MPWALALVALESIVIKYVSTACEERNRVRGCNLCKYHVSTHVDLLTHAFFCNIRRGGLGPYIRWVRGPHQHALSVTVRRAGSEPSTVVFWRGLKPHLPPLVRKELTVACLSSLQHACKTAPLYAGITAVTTSHFQTLQKLSQSKYSKYVQLRCTSPLRTIEN